MKTKLSSLLFIMLLINAVTTNAQEDGLNQNCLLWEVTGNNLRSPSYIFGTIHMIPKSDYFFPKIWKEKLASCEVLAVEADMDLSLQEQIALIPKMQLPKGKMIEDYMTPEEYDNYKTKFIDSLGIKESKLEKYNQFKPFYIYSFVLMEVIDTKVKMYEKELTKIANKKGLEIFGLETVEYQMSLVDSISIEEQIKMFLIKDEGLDIKSEYYKSVKTYKEQNYVKMYDAAADDSEEAIEFMNKFLHNRNENWIPKIIKLMHEKPTFVAVGAAHLGGEKGILNLLKEEGYTLKPVKIN